MACSQQLGVLQGASAVYVVAVRSGEEEVPEENLLHMPKQEALNRDLLEGHPRYKKLKDLNEGTFGIVMLALDQATNERVSYVMGSWNAQASGFA